MKIAKLEEEIKLLKEENPANVSLTMLLAKIITLKIKYHCDRKITPKYHV